MAEAFAPAKGYSKFAKNKTTTLRIADKNEAARYLSASEAYSANESHYRSMDFDGWPKLAISCLYCGAPDCAVYKGYYQRHLVCPELEFEGRIVVRTGFCKTYGIKFSLVPSFVARYKKLSIYGIMFLQESYRLNNNNLHKAIDALMDSLGEEFYLPVASALRYLSHQFLPP